MESLEMFGKDGSWPEVIERDEQFVKERADKPPRRREGHGTPPRPTRRRPSTPE